MYEALILLDPDTDIPASRLEVELKRFYAGKASAPNISATKQSVVLQWPGYQLEVARSSLPHVIIESAEIAERFAGDHPAKDRIALCHTRFEMAGDDDPNMDHFNDYLYVGEALARLGRVYRFDSSSAEFMDD